MKQPHRAETRQRLLGAVAMVALFIIGGCMVLQQRLADKQEDITNLRTDGPFPATLASGGIPQLGSAVLAFHRGEVVGWATTLCAPPDSGQMIQVRLLQIADNHVLLYRERDLTPDPRGCSSTIWAITLPSDTPAGQYMLQRFLLLTPPSQPPRIHTLPALAVDVAPS